MNVTRSLAARILSPFALCALAALVLSAVEGCAPAPTLAPTAAPPTAAPAATSAPAPVATTASAAPTVGSANATDPTSVIKLGRIQNFGLFLTDGADRTLYATDNDKKDTSTCIDKCAQNWPPFIVRAAPQAAPAVQGSPTISGTLISTFMRADGTLQAEYDGRPLYYYSGDKNVGDVKGHNLGNVWHVLSPRGSPMLNPAPTQAP